MLTDDTTASVFMDIDVCDWQIAVFALIVLALPLLLLLFVAYRGYG